MRCPGSPPRRVAGSIRCRKTCRSWRTWRWPAGDGKNLLYHTTFLWAGELADGGNHSWNELNWIVGGQSSGDLQTGRFIDAKGKTNADLFVSLAKLMGTDMTTFGDPKAFTGAISAIKA